MQTIGLGLDFQHRHSYGKPLFELLDSLRERLSHISIVGLQSDQEARFFKSLAQQLPVLHHLTGVAPAGVSGVNLAELRRQRVFTDVLGALWCLEDIGIWNIGPYDIPYFAPPVLCEEVLRATIDGVLALQKEIVVPFLAELPSCSFIAGDIDLETFFTRLISETGCGMVLDVSHVFSYAIYRDVDPLAVLARLPLDGVIEIHVAGGSVHPMHQWRYRDTHTEPILDKVVEILCHAIPMCPNLRAITYEIGLGIPLELVDAELQRLEQLMAFSAFVPSITKLHAQ